MKISASPTFGVVTVNRMSLRIPGSTSPSTTLQNVAGKFSSRTTHCCPSMSLTIKSGSPTRSGALLSLAKSGMAERHRTTTRKTWIGRFIHPPFFVLDWNEWRESIRWRSRNPSLRLHVQKHVDRGDREQDVRAPG